MKACPSEPSEGIRETGLDARAPEELYGSFAALLDAVEETFMRAGASQEASERFKEVLGQAVDHLMEIGGKTSE